MKPPSGGPQIGPISAGMVTSDMALTRFFLSMLRTMMRRPTGVIIAPPMPWTMRASTNCSQRMRGGAADRAEHEYADGGAEHVARAEAVGGPAARRNEDRKRQEVGRDRELQRQRIGAERARNRRQRSRDHRRVHVFHEQGGGDDQRYDAIVGRRFFHARLSVGWRAPACGAPVDIMPAAWPLPRPCSGRNIFSRRYRL